MIRSKYPKSLRDPEKSNDDFEVFWRRLVKELRVKQNISCWTKEKGNFGEDFEAVFLGGEYIRCTTPRSKYFQNNVSKEDFNVVHSSWQDYMAGKTNKYYMLKGPFAKFVISILHQYENFLEDNA